MSLLLTESKCDPNVFDFLDQYPLLHYCYINKKHKAFNMLITNEESKKVIDPNLFEKLNKTSIYGELFYKVIVGTEDRQDLRFEQKLKDMHDNISDNIDVH